MEHHPVAWRKFGPHLRQVAVVLSNLDRLETGPAVLNPEHRPMGAVPKQRGDRDADDRLRSPEGDGDLNAVAVACPRPGS